MFKAAVTKIQKSQALVKPLKAGPLSARIILDGKNIDEFHPGREVIGHVEVKYNQEFLFCGQSKIRSKAGSDGSYSFSFKIPSDMPGSYKSEFGQISYHIYIRLDYGENKMTKRADRPITIKGQLEIDPDDPDTCESVEIEERDHKAVKQVAHNRKSTESQLRFMFRIDQSGFIGGETIPFLFEIENPRKGYKITGMKVELIKEIIYHGGKIQKKVRTNLAAITHVKKEEEPNAIFFDAAERHTKENQWEGSLVIPRGSIPTTKGVIDICYFLKVYLNTKTVKLVGLCPLTIGTTREGLTFEAREEASKFYTHTVNPQDTFDED